MKIHVNMLLTNLNRRFDIFDMGFYILLIAKNSTEQIYRGKWYMFSLIPNYSQEIKDVIRYTNFIEVSDIVDDCVDNCIMWDVDIKRIFTDKILEYIINRLDHTNLLKNGLYVKEME